ncbi:hypothetical protein GLAREA_09452 [Glarea lozoyensis ATCC 20868]|uniref:F-box domain-containing protein n=1 Tax=Glarea lozoyensis (strain ATCC 20868 / MF5171) TaxID=1116229 RepID=S3CPF2_GLAL2|nr:uncharacterized protein GLAREA_09452 [Glarea lozoyensis ATCC 20868]EPE28332.1 hypothetical protein GLAREA_09452 [Glarea lozoyensis ATCC 20868]
MDSYSGIDMKLLEHTDGSGLPCLPPHPRPSYPDEVMDGRTLTSNARLLKLPQEVLTQIIGDIDTFADLRKFALSSKDCCQVARSRLFCGVYPKCNRARYKLTSLMSQEAKLRKDHQPYPSIGPCVRHIKFRVDENMNWLWLCPKNQQGWRSDSGSILIQDRVEGFPETISHLMLSPTLRTIGLSYLHYIIRRELLPTEKRLRPSKIKLQLQNLYISNCSFTYKRRVRGKDEPKPHNLASNYLEPIVKQLIDAASPKLETFYWDMSISARNTYGTEHARCSLVEKEPRPNFEQLRRLFLKVAFEDDGTWECLLDSPGLRDLGVHVFLNDDIWAKSLEKAGRMEKLRSFEWSSKKDYLYTGNQAPRPGIPVDFLKSNDQITRLSLVAEKSMVANVNDVLGLDVLPLLAQSFRNLTSLRIWCDGWTMPLDHLQYISQLKQLEKLSLGVDRRAQYWFICHPEILFSLRPLRYLKAIAFHRDIYPRLSEDYDPASNPYRHFVSPYSYYDDKMVNQNPEPLVWDSSITRQEVANHQSLWWDIHRQRMKSYADEYLEALPVLQWMYLGQCYYECDRSVPESKKFVLRDPPGPHDFSYGLDALIGWRERC